MTDVDEVRLGRDRQRRAGGRRAARRRRRSPLDRLLRVLPSRRPAGRRQAAPTAPSRSRPALRAPGRRALLAGGGAVALLGLLAAALAVLPDRLGGQPAGAPAAGGAAAAADAGEQDTLLLVRLDATGTRAAGLTLLAAGADGRAAAVFIPSTTLVEIPGVGLDRIGLAQRYGGAPLVEAAVENALGIDVDGTATITAAGLGALLQRAGGAEVDIPDRLVARAADGTGTVAFEAGRQFLNGVRLAEYWAFEQRGETELDSFPRQQRALDAVLASLADEALRESLLGTLPAGLTATVPAEQVGATVGRLAGAAAEGAVGYQLLPVAPFGAADGPAEDGTGLGTSYQLLEDEAAALVADVLAGSVPDRAGADRLIAVQVLNGVGSPGVGQAVDARLEGLPVRIVRTDNARSFDFPQTQVLVYDESPAVLAAARQVQAALGVGTILVSRQPQSVVDLTIVVGADFQGTSAPAVDPGP